MDGQDAREVWTRASLVALAYALFGVLWILFSDRLLNVYVGDDLDRLNWFQTYKGWLFVGVTAIFIHSMVHRVLMALLASKARLKLAMQAAGQGLFDVDLGSEVVEVSPEYPRMLGIDPAGFRETLAAWRARLHPDDRERDEERFKHCLAGTTPAYAVEARHRMADGEWKWILSVGAVVERGKNGLPRRLVGTHTDIDALKRTDTALKRFRFIVENAGQEVYLIRPDGTLFYANHAAAASLGYVPTEMVGLGIDDVDALHSREAFRAHVEDLRKQMLPAFETVHKTRDGRCIPKEVKAAYLETGGETFVCAFAQDISMRREAEESIRRLNQELEQRVDERTLQLEAANHELESFSYSVSHDLKAPLRGIDGYSQILLEDYAGDLDDDARALIGHIRRGVHQMHELIEDLLAYSRMERQVIEKRAIDLDALIDSVLAAHGDEIETRHIRITRLSAPLSVRADRDGMTLIVRNLLENALKFTRACPRPEIEFGASAHENLVRLWVRDNGIGFDMRYHDRIFEVFQRLQRAEDYPGTGVGLAMVKRAATRMGGRVWAESAPDSGATFYLELPQ